MIRRSVSPLGVLASGSVTLSRGGPVARDLFVGPRAVRVVPHVARQHPTRSLRTAWDEVGHGVDTATTRRNNEPDKKDVHKME